MIINIAGTSGSGKSYLMRSFLDWARGALTVKEHDSGYEVILPREKRAFICGKYDVPTGGCDQMRDVSEVFTLLRIARGAYDHVLYEGLFVMNMTRGPQLATDLGKGLCVLQLTTPLGVCFKSIDARRAERGAPPLEARNNTKGNYVRATNYCSKMQDAGASVIRVSREEALPVLKELLGC